MPRMKDGFDMVDELYGISPVTPWLRFQNRPMIIGDSFKDFEWLGRIDDAKVTVGPFERFADKKLFLHSDSKD